jgi:hypothetical protein
MIEEFIPKLQQELELQGPLNREGAGAFALQLDATTITISDVPPGFLLAATLGELSLELVELFYVKLLRGNFMRQASYGAVLGLDETGTKIMLQLYVPRKVNFREFKERLEDFINVIDFWNAEIALHKQAPQVS